MANLVFSPPPLNTLAVEGTSARFAVGRIFCAGRNYTDHIVEMGGTSDAAPPVFFCKPADALVSDGGDVAYPRATTNLQHEIELVLALGKPLSEACEAQAAKAVYGLAAGVDLTRRDAQAVAKKKGGPWETAKAFDMSAPAGTITTLAAPLESVQGPISLAVNGEGRQHGDLAQMLWQPARLLAHLSTLFDLKCGDLVFTGTPAGVGPLQRGDQVRGDVAGTSGVRFTIV